MEYNDYNNQFEQRPASPDKKKSKTPVLLITVLVILAIVAVMAVCINIFSPKEPTLANKFKIYKTSEDAYSLVVGKKVYSDVIDGTSAFMSSISIDNTKHIVISTDKDGEKHYYYADKKGVTEVDVEGSASSFLNSEDGTYVVYIAYEKADDGKENYTIFSYNTKKKETKEIYTSDKPLDCVISPDGKTVLYSTPDDEGKIDIYLYKGGKSSYISTGLSPVAVANGGKYIYAIETNDEGQKALYSLKKNGDKNKISNIDSTSVVFNKDLSQVIFHKDGDTYISKKAKEPIELSSKTIYPASPYNLNCGNANVYYEKDLTKCIFAGAEGIYHISKNEAIKIVTGYDEVGISEDLSVLAYSKKDGSLYIAKASKKYEPQKIEGTENVAQIIVSADGKRIYYIDDSYDLFYVDGKKAKRVMSGVVDGDENADKKGRFYVIDEDDALYCISKGKATKIADDIKSAEATEDGVLYRTEDDVIYLCTNGKSGKRILDLYIGN